MPLGRLGVELTAKTFSARSPGSSPKPPCRKRSVERRRPRRVPARSPRSLSPCPRALRSPAVGGQRQPARLRAGGACVRVLGRRPSPRPPLRQRLPLPRRARPVPVPGGGPNRRRAASPSPPAFPAARPPPAGLQGLPRSSSRRESGSERARGRAEAAWFGVAAPERGAREDAGPPLSVRSLAPRLPHSARSHPFPA